MPAWETKRRIKPSHRADPNKQRKLTLADSYFDEGEFNFDLAQFYKKQGNREEERKYRKIATRCFHHAKRLRGRDRA